MKRVILTLIASICVLIAFPKTGNFSKGCVLKPGVQVICTTPGIKFIPFIDEETYMVGLLRTDYTIALPPIYEKVYNGGYLLMPVKWRGKWGVVDLGARYIVPGHEFNEPLILCEYNKVEVVNDYVVICDGKRIDIRELGYEAY